MQLTVELVEKPGVEPGVELGVELGANHWGSEPKLDCETSQSCVDEFTVARPGVGQTLSTIGPASSRQSGATACRVRNAKRPACKAVRYSADCAS